MDLLIALVATMLYFLGAAFTYALLSDGPSDERMAAVSAALWPAFWIILAASIAIFAPFLLGLWAGSKVKERLK